ncbi:hypothetical protein E7811_06845 [Aliigemmobacter aestuarii]|uniref:Sulfotransferase domain-containing protein n=1 Tax=Aliigemmobacter aestuarii TaxID=1445661 RepID=A0A4S3MS82_9RHOB|nr:sulfotransferase domain-containing protein [Gemmobacter aestuarii]THD85408.1 hypothetical protein E7811_06845 [Gemmobacter aestuarii]
MKRFVLGLGAQKAGTTWLHSYLGSFDGVDFGPLKEYHVWDAIADPRLKGFVVSDERLASLAGKPQYHAIKLRHDMQRDPNLYASFFDGLIEAGNWMTGDITPSYAGLDVATLRDIRDRLEDRGFDLRVVYLMRDPFERVWSMARMQNRDNPAISDDERVLADIRALENLYKSEQYRLRTEYHRTIERIEQVFTPEQTFFGFYEDLFTVPSLERIEAFFGVPVKDDHLSVQVNVSEKKVDVPEKLERKIRTFYAPVYDACAQKFPQTRTLWVPNRA